MRKATITGQLPHNGYSPIYSKSLVKPLNKLREHRPTKKTDARTDDAPFPTLVPKSLVKPLNKLGEHNGQHTQRTSPHYGGNIFFVPKSSVKPLNKFTNRGKQVARGFNFNHLFFCQDQLHRSAMLAPGAKKLFSFTSD
jgi:ribosomal protein L13E